LGDGIDTIIDEQGIFGANSIVFGDGITPEMLSLELGSLLIRVGDGGDAIHLERFDPANAEAGADVARFEFADGSELSYAQLIERGFDISGTSGDDTIDGTSVSDRMEGGLGSDTYRFGAGSGADAIREAASESDTDVLEVQANSDAVTVSREGDALVLGLTGTPDRVAVDWFADRAARLESVRFLDGETWDAATFQAQAGNAAPSVANPIGEQSFEAGAPFTFTVPEGTFADEDPSTLQLGATLFGGGALPAWLSFDAQTATFSGNPAKKQNGISRVVVTATDADGESVAAEFGLVIHAKAGSNVNGSNGDDILYGGSGDETLSAKDGNDALFGGEGNDLLKGATGQDVLQGGEGSDTLRGGKGQNLLDGGSGDDVLYGGQGSSLIVGGSGNDTIRTGQGSDVILFNRGDGSDTVIADREGNNTLSFGGGIRYSDLELSRSGKDLVISAGGDDQVVLKNWYGGKRSVTNLQIVLDDYDPDCADPMQNRQVQTFDFLGLVSTFDQARKATPGVTSWAISNALLQFHLAGADDLALGGDLAYWYAKNRGLGGISLAAAQQVIGAAGFGADAQSLRPFGGLQEGFVKLT
jgi:Ca2+-binding RTX toxin-like protein